MKECKIDGCNKKYKGLGYCQMHYDRFKRHGNPLSGGRFRIKNQGKKCKVNGCDQNATALKFCNMHWRRNNKFGDPEFRKNQYGRFKNWAKDDSGYILKWAPDDPNSKCSGYLYQHRHVMSEKIGRPLIANENVHHVNGDRSDNKIENLELWKSGQPSGQRIQDRVKYAIEIIITEYDAANLLCPSIKQELSQLVKILK